MQTVKLTLSIPERLLHEAKAYSQRAGEPLSRLVSRYFSVLTRQGTDKEKVTSKVRRVTGIAKSKSSDETLLGEALGEKYHLRGRT